MPDAKIRFEGQELSLAEEVASDDATLRAALVTVYPSLATAEIHRTREDGTLVVTAVKRAGSKGAGDLAQHRVLRVLTSAPQYINPAVGVSHRLHLAELAGTLDVLALLDERDEIHAAIRTGSADIEAIRSVLAALRHSRPVPSSVVPEGF